MSVVVFPKQPHRPRLYDPSWSVLHIGQSDLRRKEDVHVWTVPDSAFDLGAARGYANLDTAVTAAGRLTNGAADGTAAVFGHAGRFFLQQTFAAFGETDRAPYELAADDRERGFKWTKGSADIVALVNGSEVLNRPADGRPRAGMPVIRPRP